MVEAKKKMKIEKTKIVWLMLPIILVVSGMVLATPTLTWMNVTAGGTSNAIKGNAKLNISINGKEYGNITNVKLWLKSNTTWINTNTSGILNSTMCQGTADMVNCTSIVMTLNTSELNDDVRYTLMVEYENQTPSYINMSSDTLTNLYIDNNDGGACGLSGISAGTRYDGADTTVTVTAKNMSRATLYVGANNYAMTELGSADNKKDTFTYTLSDIPEGIYDVYAKTGDDIDTNTCGTVSGITILHKSGKIIKINSGTVQNSGPGAQQYEAISGNGQKSQQQKIVILFFVGLVAWMLLKKKGR